jgi:hypothetical protein
MWLFANSKLRTEILDYGENVCKETLIVVQMY